MDELGVVNDPWFGSEEDPTSLMFRSEVDPWVGDDVDAPLLPGGLLVGLARLEDELVRRHAPPFARRLIADFQEEAEKVEIGEKTGRGPWNAE